MDATLLLLTQNDAITIFGGICVVFLGALTAFLACRNIAVFNDGVRPLVGQKKMGFMNHKALAGASFAMSIGYVIGFIPFSVTSNIIVFHTILLGSEMFGLLFPNNKKRNSYFAAIVAAAYSAALYWGLQYLNKGISTITYPGFGFDLGMIVDGAFPFVFAMFPAVASYLMGGWKQGVVTLLASVATYLLLALLGWQQAHLYPMAITLLVGTSMLFGFTLYRHFHTKRVEARQARIMTTAGEVRSEAAPIAPVKPIVQFDAFTKNANEIKNSQWYFVVTGALAAMAVTSFAAAPLVSLALQTTSIKSGNIISAVIADTTWVIGFLPLVVLTALLTGSYSPVGLTAVFVFGDVGKIIGATIVDSTGNQNMYFIAIAIAGILGGSSLFAEIRMLKGLSSVLMKVPGIQGLSDSMRTGITRTINYAFLFGGIVAAFIMGQNVGAALGTSDMAAGLRTWLPSMGAGIVIALYIINSLTKKKIAEIAIGPLGALIVGVVFNVIYFAFVH